MIKAPKFISTFWGHHAPVSGIRISKDPTCTRHALHVYCGDELLRMFWKKWAWPYFEYAYGMFIFGAGPVGAMFWSSKPEHERVVCKWMVKDRGNQ